jgi:hypothetical protein
MKQVYSTLVCISLLWLTPVASCAATNKPAKAGQRTVPTPATKAGALAIADQYIAKIKLVPVPLDFQYPDTCNSLHAGYLLF